MTNSRKLNSFVAIIVIFFCSAVSQVQAMDFSGLLSDQEQNTQPAAHKCYYCPLKLSVYELQLHMSNCPQKKYYYPCGECPAELRINDLLLHKKTAHQNDIKNSCWYCHMRMYAPEHFQGMREYHKVVESNICSVCIQNFPYAHNYLSQSTGLVSHTMEATSTSSNQQLSEQVLLDDLSDNDYAQADRAHEACQEEIFVEDAPETDDEPEGQWKEVELEDGQIRYVCCRCRKPYRSKSSWLEKHIAKCRK